MRRHAATACTALAVLATAALVASCSGDPVHDALVNSFGPEVNSVPQGEYHRAGQPCATCHSEKGPAKTVFVMGGTVFYAPYDNTKPSVGVDQVNVTMIDSVGSSFTAHTNCVGNFFVTPDQWSPSFPVIVRVDKNGTSAPMASHISREPSCTGCHKDPPYFDSHGHVYLSGTGNPPYVPPNCPVSPLLSPVGGGQ